MIHYPEQERTEEEKKALFAKHDADIKAMIPAIGSDIDMALRFLKREGFDIRIKSGYVGGLGGYLGWAVFDFACKLQGGWPYKAIVKEDFQIETAIFGTDAVIREARARGWKPRSEMTIEERLDEVEMLIAKLTPATYYTEPRPRYPGG